MVKTPGHSVVKSRLAAGLGNALAREFHGLAAAAVASVARRAVAVLGMHAYWAVAEPGAQGEWTGLPVLLQGGGGLGQRMARVQDQLVARHGAGMLVGADSPQLEAGLLREARDWIGGAERRMALGPAEDGGFWLVAANFAPPLTSWESVEYSQADTADRLRTSMSGLGQWRVLPQLVDVDRACDLPALAAALHHLGDPTPEQRALGAWVDQCIAGQGLSPHRKGQPSVVGLEIGAQVNRAAGPRR